MFINSLGNTEVPFYVVMYNILVVILRKWDKHANFLGLSNKFHITWSLLSRTFRLPECEWSCPPAPPFAPWIHPQTPARSLWWRRVPWDRWGGPGTVHRRRRSRQGHRAGRAPHRPDTPRSFHQQVFLTDVTYGFLKDMHVARRQILLYGISASLYVFLFVICRLFT